MAANRQPLKQSALAILLLAFVAQSQAAVTDLSNAPLVVSSASAIPVMPNVFLMMDDSGSMGWDYMPDDVSNFSGNYGYASSQCNGVYYNPNITYAPPVDSTGASYANSTFTSAWNDGYNTAGSSTNLNTSFSTGGFSSQRAFYFVYSGTQTTNALRNYYNTNSTFYRECNSTIGSTPGSSVFSKRTLSTTETTTITVSGSNSTSVSSIKVNGVELMSAPPSTASTNSSTVATNVAAKITLNGFSATASGSTITITGPTSAANFTPVITQSGSMTLTPDVFPDTAAASLTNFANWYSYYHTRILMMKTATGLAFKPLGTNYRVGFGTMNNNGGSKFLNVGQFTAAQRLAWYNMLYSTSANNSTPLLGALANIGKYYAHKLPSNTLNGVAANDPIEYSCQQNFTILSTDGFWNSQTGNSKLDNTTAVGQQDGTEVRPMYDGASQTIQTSTPTTTVVRKQTVQNTTSTTPWMKTTVTIGAACSTPSSTPPNTISAYMNDNSHKMALGLAASDPDPNNGHCVQLGGSGNNTAWFCRGSSNSNPAVSSSTVTDSTGTTWYLVNSFSGNSNSAACTTNRAAWGSGYSTSMGACPGTVGISGNLVSTTTQGYNQVVTGTTTTVTDSTTVVTNTVVTVNGQVQSNTNTTSGPTTATVSSSTAVTSDTGAPSGTTTWTTTSTTNNVCTAAPLPASSGPTAGTATVTNNGSPTVTTLSTNTTTGTPTVSSSSSGGTSNTLADVAEYYYMTDLRDSTLGNATGVLGTDVTTNNVPSSGLDAASWQHMTTFTLGLGARGNMVFSPTYLSDTSGDFYAVKNGSLANAASGVCTWQADGTVCNWPTPVSNTQTTIDDLWHAAVDGRGTYFSATDPSTLATAISAALSGVTARTGSSAAATTSNPNITSGDNFVFSSTFVTQDWYGELVRQQLDLTTGQTLSTIDWSAQGQLDANAARTIYARNVVATNGLQAFNTTNYGADANFNLPHIAGLSQFCASGATCLSAASQTAASGNNLVSFLRGDRTNEGILTDTTKYYRQRVHVLGDIVNGEAVYVKGSQIGYADLGYSAFASTIASRQGMVYVAANDGMLHAFYAASDMMDANGNVVSTGGTNVSGGAEAWAYIPTQVMPNLFKLADKNYANNHQYLVDGTPVAGEICVSGCGTTTSVWKSILVGGLNGGGRGYYALDITNPASPKSLWEFSDTNMGYTYGNPQIAKLKNGTWVVFVTSGYNNVSPGDGVGHLYVLNAYTGALITDISTGAGNTATPSGLARIIAQVANTSSDATTLEVYGGDLLGNVWRFDVNGDTGAAGFDAQLLATLYGSGGLPQPVMGKPEVGIVSGTTMVYVGTGRYLGTSDLTNTDPQSIYGIKDPLAAGTTPSVAIYANPRSYTPNSFVRQTLTVTTCPAGSPATICTSGQTVVTSSRNTVNLSTNSGWYVDLPGTGERATNDPTLQLGTLGFTTNTPSASSCTVGGTSTAYFFDYRTGGPVSTSTTNVVGVKLGNALATRPVYVHLPNNTVVQLVRLSDGTTLTTNVPIGSGAAGTRRVSWRELINQ